MEDVLETQIQKNKEGLLNKINELIIGERKRFIEQYGQGESVKYYTAKRTLKNEIVAQHLGGERTIGCHYIGSASKFLCFDIDEPDPEIPLQLLKMLKDAGFDHDELHVEHSGSKGWHIWMFFSGNIPISMLVSFGRYFIEEMGCDGHCIELRPEQTKNSRGIKLPFAIHRKTMIRTMFLEHNLFPTSDSVQYFLDIVPTSNKRFEQLAIALLEEVSDNSEIKDQLVQQSEELVEEPIQSVRTPEFIRGSSLNQLAEKLLKYGIPQRTPGDSFGRHYYQYFIALFFKDQGFSEKKTIVKVIEWALREKRYNRSSSTEEEIYQDVTIDVHHIYAKNKKFYSAIPNELSFSIADIEMVSQFEEPITQYVAWAILVLGRMFHHQGRLFFSVRQLAAMTGYSRSTVHRRLQILIAMNFIRVIERGQYRSEKSSVYHIPALLNVSEVEFKVTTESAEMHGIFEESFEYVQKYIANRKFRISLAQ
ncbi:IclR-like helix-turn-helix domain-containing protein [Fontibacillus phaseoli]|uniref:IclR-like helix-turn-helix domain-containing protein n=1 Tax=Fontibacillus phaseoli TaxID=1416533 RepID=A0A369B1U2_9BACL|nr:helix-turn-helix domain-containing protein [Fontibacillus phaseoli]RCX15632.1 IclR-like helix-turn-helix domain-containing protein [Fontibacillus phaseoli]